MAAADAYNFDEAVNRTRHESALGLPPSDKLFQRMELAGRLVRRHEEDPSLDEDALCKETREAAVGLRKVGPVNTKGRWPKLPTALEIMLRAARTAKRGGSLCATTAQPLRREIGGRAIYRLAALISCSCVTSVLVCLALSQESVGRFSSNKLQECGGVPL